MEVDVLPARTALNIGLTGLSIVGHACVKRRHRRGNWFWQLGKALGQTMFTLLEQWITKALSADSVASCVQGLVHWGRLEKSPAVPGDHV
uniref:Uncharacterized protein n=1 Tax=mine drainage metagenome TaxID=410659 RepID=E6PMZ8_9ZZZZ